MPAIVFTSLKGGTGKTTAATILATELVEGGASVTLIDASPNRLRCWFVDAGARVRRLHLPPGGDQFRSRRAHRLAYVSQREGARGTLAKFTAAFPGLTIADVRSGLPWNEAFLDRTSEGLESAGMRP